MTVLASYSAFLTTMMAVGVVVGEIGVPPSQPGGNPAVYSTFPSLADVGMGQQDFSVVFAESRAVTI